MCDKYYFCSNHLFYCFIVIVVVRLEEGRLDLVPCAVGGVFLLLLCLLDRGNLMPPFLWQSSSQWGLLVLVTGTTGQC